MTKPTSSPGGAAADCAVHDAIQTLMAARLVRGFVPLAILVVVGVAGVR